MFFVFLLQSVTPHHTEIDSIQPKREENEKYDGITFDEIEEEEDPYNLCPEDIYDTVDTNTTYNPAVLNRPPAPIPRPESESDKPSAYISRGIYVTFNVIYQIYSYFKLIFRLKF